MEFYFYDSSTDKSILAKRLVLSEDLLFDRILAVFAEVPFRFLGRLLVKGMKSWTVLEVAFCFELG